MPHDAAKPSMFEIKQDTPKDGTLTSRWRDAPFRNGNCWCSSKPSRQARLTITNGCLMQIGVETSKAVDQRRVFVVDDDEITRAALQFMLHDEIETHELASLEEAFAKGVGWLTPHVVILGVSFLKSRGLDLIAELKARFPDARILVVCDKSDEATAVQAMTAGAHGTLVKPLALEAVRKKVDTILGRGGAPLIQLGLL